MPSILSVAVSINSVVQQIHSNRRIQQGTFPEGRPCTSPSSPHNSCDAGSLRLDENSLHAAHNLGATNIDIAKGWDNVASCMRENLPAPCPIKGQGRQKSRGVSCGEFSTGLCHFLTLGSITSKILAFVFTWAQSSSDSGR